MDREVWGPTNLPTSCFSREKEELVADSSLGRSKLPDLRKHLYSHHRRDRYEHDHDPSVHGPPDNPTHLAAHNFRKVEMEVEENNLRRSW